MWDVGEKSDMYKERSIPNPLRHTFRVSAHPSSTLFFAEMTSNWATNSFLTVGNFLLVGLGSRDLVVGRNRQQLSFVYC